jgi:hypothetical protein
MARLNTVGARMMRKYKSRGGTDVTGFGILGHSRNLALGQEASVRLEIDTLPLLAGAAKADALEERHQVRVDLLVLECAISALKHNTIGNPPKGLFWF